MIDEVRPEENAVEQTDESETPEKVADGSEIEATETTEEV